MVCRWWLGVFIIAFTLQGTLLYMHILILQFYILNKHCELFTRPRTPLSINIFEIKYFVWLPAVYILCRFMLYYLDVDLILLKLFFLHIFIVHCKQSNIYSMLFFSLFEFMFFLFIIFELFFIFCLKHTSFFFPFIFKIY